VLLLLPHPSDLLRLLLVSPKLHSSKRSTYFVSADGCVKQQLQVLRLNKDWSAMLCDSSHAVLPLKPDMGCHARLMLLNVCCVEYTLI
jgi:hypothetical protein